MRKPYFFVAALTLLCGCSPSAVDGPDIAREITFVGSEACAQCHDTQYTQWRGSHHQLAMQPANANTVLGDFDEATFEYFDETSRFFKRGDAYYINTPGADGQPADFRVTHTFGVAPLQQYLVDGERGRKQAFTVVWDARPLTSGGQRWYHLQSSEHITPTDPLHWTGRYFAWNSMCAECHSTDLQANYNIVTDTFDTTFSEISVGCEACHGPGSRHISLAGQSSPEAGSGFDVNLDDRAGGTWRMNSSTGIAQLSSPGASQQTESCGRCHARRSPIAANYEYGKALSHTHMPALLDEGLYHADGRILDEVYVYGSFRQSKMYAAGVTCSDCHNPHSGALHAGPDPNNTCQQCHAPAVFAVVTHSETRVGDCVSCHMPQTTYMGTDARRDHSFRLPGTANDPAHFGAAIAAGRAGKIDARLLTHIANERSPAIVHATLLGLLASSGLNLHAGVFTDGLQNDDPLVRLAALRALGQQDPTGHLNTAMHLLSDENRGVRIEAARTFLSVANALPTGFAEPFVQALDEYRHSLEINASMPGAALQLAELESRTGNATAARERYEHALRIGRQNAAVRHAYGLHLVRAGQSDIALTHLRAASELAPENPRFIYVYGVALNSTGQSNLAVQTLATAHQRFVDDFDIGWALATIYRDRGEIDRARSIVEQLNRRFPDNPQIHALAESLQQ